MLLALVQLKVTGNKVEDLKTALLLIKQAADNGAKLISLPECFNCPYGTQYFADYAEPIPGETSNTLSKIAKDLKVYIIGGSIPETRGEKIYNTTTVFGPDGTLIGTYSKLKVTGNKVEDLKTALLLIKQAADNGAKLISLPECFNCPYGTQYFADYAEPIPGETSNTLSKIAKDLKVYIIGGSIPETRGEKIYNTTTVFGPDGTLIGTYSKVFPCRFRDKVVRCSSVNLYNDFLAVEMSSNFHPKFDLRSCRQSLLEALKLSGFMVLTVVDLCGVCLCRFLEMRPPMDQNQCFIHLSDVNVPGKLVFTESSVLSPGNNLFTFQAGPLKVGLGICYDLRFPELAHLYDKQGCNLLIYPGAFNMITGPAHWLSLLTARALDNQLYVAGCGPARDENATYVTWGHSTVVDPWGKVIASTAEKEGIVYAEIDADYVDAIRNQIPIHFQKRNDIYQGNNLVES
eukprot:gene16766-8228_t